MPFADVMLERLLSLPLSTVPVPAVEDWWSHQQVLFAAAQSPIERAVLGGFAADRVAWAFGAGYQAALRRLDPTLPNDQIACLCVTESGGNAPRAIASTLTPEGAGYRLDGHKKWSTLGPAGACLIVVARLSGADQPAHTALKAVRVAVGQPGVRVDTMPPPRFVPELPHAEVRLEGVHIAPDALVPGDGYTAVVKPFRSIEDIHVSAAVLAHLLREARRLAWPAPWMAECAATLDALVALAGRDPLGATTHIALEGALIAAHRLYAAADANYAAGGDGEAATRWKRDRSLFQVAGTARKARFQRACEVAGLPSPHPSSP
ncbi:MAG: acyl-CoA dehydrogenase family protein [Burkholderiales bacterium]|nr:acyl-CoA dehydrogenase family protein [Burkholderiales bacterium]